MSWPISRSTGFVVSALAWNEVIDALENWGGHVNAGAYNLSNVGTLTAAIGRFGYSVLNNTSGQQKYLSIRTNDVERWRLFCAETSDENFYIARYLNDGTWAGNPFTVKRSNGFIGINNSNPASPLDVYGTGTATFDTSLQVANSASSAAVAAGIVRIISSNSSASNLLLNCVSGAGEVLRVVSNGTVDINGDLNVSGTINGTGGTSGTAYFNVLDYGAVGDGSTNDTAAVQTAIDAAEVAGGVVFFPGGKTYSIGQVWVRGANVTLSGYGATIVPRVASNTIIHDANGGGFSYFKVLGLRFVNTTYGYPSNLTAITTMGAADGTVVPSFITIRDCTFEEYHFACWIDKSNDVVIDNIAMYGDTRIWCGSSTDTGALSYAHRVQVSNIYYYPNALPFGGAGVPLILFQRVGGGTIRHVMINSLRGGGDGIWITNDTQGVTIESGLILGAVYGVRLFGNNIGSGDFWPSFVQIRGLNVDQHTLVGILVDNNVWETIIDGAVITGANVATTEAHGIYSLSSNGTTIRNCHFQNIKQGNGIYVGANAGRHIVEANRFWCQLTAACINIAAGTSTNMIVRNNFRDSRDTSAYWIVNGGGTGVTIANNYPTN